ncbi:hypothetical protein L4D08_24505 [Photobacterium chitinilyticum]|uniref:virulence factor TspB C-terminal domain-related protein n=1 Tax=Photobacterium chitinilyticum TaxID=2485123 RepID=UPI003D124B63
MRYFLLVLLLFCSNSYAGEWVMVARQGGAAWFCEREGPALLKRTAKKFAGRYSGFSLVVKTCIPRKNNKGLGYFHGIVYAMPIGSCNEGQYPEYPSTECLPDPEPCLGGGTPVNGICPPIGPGDDDNPPTGGGDDDNPPTGGGDDDNPPAGGGDDDNPPTGGGGDDNPPTGGGGDDNPPTGGGGDDNPPTGGGGDDNPPTGGGGDDNPPTGGGGGNPPTGGIGFPDFCRDNPDICLYPPDDPACYDNPALCDVPENEDLLATIRQVTEAVKDQHFNTNTVIKTNTLNTANNTNDLLSATEANHDQLKKIASNTNSIANNTSDANALIKNNTAKIVGAIKDIEGNDYSGQLSVIKSELTQMGNELQKGFCDKNPNHESCVEKKADSSSCEKFVCTGEPVLCILLEVEHQKKCLLPDFGSLEESLGDLVSQGDPSNLLQGDVLDFSNPDTKYLNGEGVNLNGFCPSSDVIDVLDGALEISYRPLCDLAIMLNPLIIAMGWVVAARNVGRGISNL